VPNIDDFKQKKLRSWDTNIAEALKIKPDKKNDPKDHELIYKEYIESIDPSEINNWQYNDRPETELGDINSLAEDLKSNGQQQPCTVRISSTSSHKYDLIIGERRWRASKLAGIKLKCVIKDLNDNDAAIAQATENDNRLDLSDYAKGMSYARLINDGIITQSDLTHRLSKSKQYVSTLLSYSKIPEPIKNKITNWSLISPRTAEKIKQLSNKGQEYIDAIISLSDILSTKKIGHSELEKKVLSKINSDSKVLASEKIYTNDGRHIFTWRQDNNSLPSIHFPKHLNKLFTESKLDKGIFTKKLISLVQDELKGIENEN
jgi:ParB family chromosome partitioning protein